MCRTGSPWQEGAKQSAFVPPGSAAVGPRCRALVITLIMLLGLTGRAAAQQLPSDIRSALNRRALRIIDQEPIPGLAIGIVLGDSLAYAGGFGVADRETGTPVRPATIFQIGSVTKSLTATLAALFVERGLLAWEDRLGDHLWEPDAVPDTSLSLRHLATHTSGLPGDAPTLRRPHDDYPILAFTHVELYASLRAARLGFEPGTDWAYSNLGYAALGHVLERVSGKPYESLLRDELLDPLGMSSTTVTLWPELSDRLARPYYYDEASSELTPYTPWDSEALAPAGGVASTVEDLGRLVAFLFRARDGRESRIGAASLEALQSIQWRMDERRGYGMGWFVEEREGVGSVLYHGGGVDGYSAWLALAPRRDLGVIVLVNSGEGDSIVGLADWILARLAGQQITN